MTTHDRWEERDRVHRIPPHGVTEVNLIVTSATLYQGIWCARSGSSFLGSLLSALPTATYFFEPFYSNPLDGLHEEMPKDASRARNFLLNIFSCDNRTIEDLYRSVLAFNALCHILIHITTGTTVNPGMEKDGPIV